MTGGGVRRVASAALAVVTLVAACTDRSDDAARSEPDTSTAAKSTPPEPSELPTLRAVRSVNGDEHPRIIDAHGRHVLLRGVNVNSLGDYHQADPDAVTVVPVATADWSQMAALGFNVVRLLISWSAVEPERGTFDGEYLDKVAAAVDAASTAGLYVVVDMHQDAWGKSLATPEGTVCPPGASPAIGWDGAPEWATMTDGASTCTFGSRESAEAVMNAWDAFYANRDGIADELIAAWRFVVREFGDRTSIAGYDLVNETNNGHDQAAATTALGTFYDRAITAIRQEESVLGVDRIAFFETTVSGLPVPPDFTDDQNIVFAPHNYGESIGSIPIEGTFDYFASLAAGYGTAMWIGEYGFFEDTIAASEKLGRYAAKEDALLTAGGAWWQWRQACGDPHSVSTPGAKAQPVQIHLRTNGCPGDVDGGVNPRWQCLWRPYPRRSPGTLHSLRSGCTSGVEFSGTTPSPGQVEVWFPGAAVQEPTVSGEAVDDVDDVEITPVDGGFVVTATVTGTYRVSVQP